LNSRPISLICADRGNKFPDSACATEHAIASAFTKISAGAFSKYPKGQGRANLPLFIPPRSTGCRMQPAKNSLSPLTNQRSASVIFLRAFSISQARRCSSIAPSSKTSAKIAYFIDVRTSFCDLDAEAHWFSAHAYAPGSPWPLMLPIAYRGSKRTNACPKSRDPT
jgi:hypothetical protein